MITNCDRFAAIALCAAVALFFMLPASTQADFALPRAATHVVIIDDGQGQGSGVMIERGKMLTAAHVVLGSKKILVGKRGVPAKVLRADKALDVALLEVPLDCPCVPVAPSEPDIDARVVVVGYPFFFSASAQVASEGRVQGKHVNNRLTTTASVAKGVSGGGVFELRAEGWLLVGILVSAYQHCGDVFSCTLAPGFSWAVDTKSLLWFLVRGPHV